MSISFGMKVPSPGIWGKCQISCPRQKLTVLKKMSHAMERDFVLCGGAGLVCAVGGDVYVSARMPGSVRPARMAAV